MEPLNESDVLIKHYVSDRGLDCWRFEDSEGNEYEIRQDRNGGEEVVES